MGNPLFSKKAFLYFAGAAIILVGGLIVIAAPYNYINFSVLQNDQRFFEVYDQQYYYPQLEVSVSVRSNNQTDVYIDLTITNNVTLDTIVINFTLTEANIKNGPENSIYLEDTRVVDIGTGNYTISIDREVGAGLFDLGLKQMSDSRWFIVVGGSLNILGIVMIIAGYLLPGTIIPADSDIIVSWGYEDKESQDESQA